MHFIVDISIDTTDFFLDFQKRSSLYSPKHIFMFHSLSVFHNTIGTCSYSSDNIYRRSWSISIFDTITKYCLSTGSNIILQMRTISDFHICPFTIDYLWWSSLHQFISKRLAQPSNHVLMHSLLRYAFKKKKRYYLGNFPNMGGVFPNPKTFVNLPSIFLYAKFILRC